jgi:hypothetical protein
VVLAFLPSNEPTIICFLQYIYGVTDRSYALEMMAYICSEKPFCRAWVCPLRNMHITCSICFCSHLSSLPYQRAVFLSRFSFWLSMRHLQSYNGNRFLTVRSRSASRRPRTRREQRRWRWRNRRRLLVEAAPPSLERPPSSVAVAASAKQANAAFQPLINLSSKLVTWEL